jgi:hypothetical protein
MSDEAKKWIPPIPSPDVDYGTDFRGSEFNRQEVFREIDMETLGLADLLVEYVQDGRLQTFEDRERFRERAKAALIKAGISF